MARPYIFLLLKYIFFIYFEFCVLVIVIWCVLLVFLDEVFCSLWELEETKAPRKEEKEEFNNNKKERARNTEHCM